MSSRYAKSRELAYTTPSGVPVAYLEPRILPLPGGGTPPATTVQSDEVHRLDLVAYRTLQNAELAWRLADANAAMDPFELCERTGIVLDLPAPQL